MRRSVVKQGVNTLMVSLPSSWARTQGIAKGGEVDVSESADRLIITSAAQPPLRRIEIDISAMGPEVLKIIGTILNGDAKSVRYTDPQTYKIARSALLRLISSHYKSGYDEILIRFDEPGAIEMIQEALSDEEMSDYEIVEQTAKYCVLQDLGGVRQERFEPTVRRIFFLLLQMAEESVPIIHSGEYEKLQPLKFLEQSNNRFTTYCRRLVSKGGFSEPDKAQFIYTILHVLEELADQYKYLFETLRAEHPSAKPSADVLAMYAQTARVIREYVHFYAEGDLKSLATLCALRVAVVDRARERFKTAKPIDAVLIHYTIVITQHLFELNEPTVSLGPAKNRT